MKATNLTISIPNKGCDKNCPYCVSKMTGYVKSNFSIMCANVEKVKTIARAAGVTNVLLTGKGEPILNMEELEFLARKFREFPLEIQTNGLKLARLYNEKNNKFLIHSLVDFGINTLAISIDTFEEIGMFENMIKEYGKYFIFRFTINITNLLKDFTAEQIFEECKRVGANQISFRKVSKANYDCGSSASLEVKKWIDENTSDKQDNEFFEWLKNTIKERGRFLMTLPFGSKLFEIDGISTAWFDYCIQDENNGDDIRSLIFQEDGHLYVAWNSNYRIL